MKKSPKSTVAAIVAALAFGIAAGLYVATDSAPVWQIVTLCIAALIFSAVALAPRFKRPQGAA